MFLDSVHDAHAHVSDCDRFLFERCAYWTISRSLTVLYCRTNSSAAWKAGTYRWFFSRFCGFLFYYFGVWNT